MQRYDVAIFGAGPVGLTFALLFARSTHARIAVIDRQGPERAQSDPRAMALSAGSLQLLARVIDLDAMQRAPIRSVQVSLRGHLGRTVIRETDEGVDALGGVVRYAELMRALEAAAAYSNSGIDMRRPVAVACCDASPSDVRWQDDRGEALAHVGVHAEGGIFERSSEAAGAERTRDYGQSAIVCEVECTQAQAGRAFERFGPGGPLALLPVPEPNRYALVWCMSAADAADLLALDDVAFAQRLHVAFGNSLGAFRLATARHAFALGLVRRTGPDDPRSARIGNAAQTLHPVAGQGLNLGLRDAHDLAQALRDAPRTQAWDASLVRFARARRADRRTTVAATDALARGFAIDAPLIHRAAGLGLALLDQSRTARSALARALMFGRRG